jgi:hypothetical protein
MNCIDSRLILTPTLLKKHFLLMASFPLIFPHCLFKEVLLGPLTHYASIMVMPPSRITGGHHRIMEVTPMSHTVRKPPVADEAPKSAALTRYDEEHIAIYLGLLDAEADGADWMEASVTVLRLDPVREPARAHRAWETHLLRAKWLAESEYRQLIRPLH